MQDEIKDTLIQCEKEKEFKFNISFKFILVISIVLTGFLSLAGIIFTILGIANQIWIANGIEFFLNQSLYYISILFCFISLVNIAVTKKPFSNILVWCTRAIGILFVIASIIFPQIEGYTTSGFVILSTGEFTFIDGSIFIIGALGILFSKIIQYGFIYQKNEDMTV